MSQSIVEFVSYAQDVLKFFFEFTHLCISYIDITETRGIKMYRRIWIDMSKK